MPRRKPMNTCNSKLLISNKICQTITQRRISEPNCPVVWIVVFDILNLLHATSRGTVRVQYRAQVRFGYKLDQAGPIRVQLRTAMIRVQTNTGTIWVQRNLTSWVQPCEDLGTIWVQRELLFGNLLYSVSLINCNLSVQCNAIYACTCIIFNLLFLQKCV